MSTEPSIFTRIINREIPAEIIYEDDRLIVIPDKFPSIPGQLLIIPKAEAAYIVDLDPELYQHMMTIMRKCMQALDTALQTVRTCVVIEGFEVPHVHIRLYPCQTNELKLDGRAMANDADLTTLAATLRPHFN
jgi:histidine triad (HIT) family protein